MTSRPTALLSKRNAILVARSTVPGEKSASLPIEPARLCVEPRRIRGLDVALSGIDGGLGMKTGVREDAELLHVVGLVALGIELRGLVELVDARAEVPAVAQIVGLPSERVGRDLFGRGRWRRGHGRGSGRLGGRGAARAGGVPRDT
jgi:hypothetical protein